MRTNEKNRNLCIVTKKMATTSSSSSSNRKKEENKTDSTQHRHMKINLHFVYVQYQRQWAYEIIEIHSTCQTHTHTHWLRNCRYALCKSSKVCHQMAINHMAAPELSYERVLYFVFNWISLIFRCARFIRFYALQLSVHPHPCGVCVCMFVYVVTHVTHERELRGAKILIKNFQAIFHFRKISNTNFSAIHTQKHKYTHTRFRKSVVHFLFDCLHFFSSVISFFPCARFKSTRCNIHNTQSRCMANEKYFNYFRLKCEYYFMCSGNWRQQHTKRSQSIEI